MSRVDMRPDRGSPGPEPRSEGDPTADVYGLQGRVLLVDPDLKHRRWLARILRTIVAEVEQREELDVSNPRGLEGFDVVVFNFDAVIDGGGAPTEDLVWLAQHQRLLLVCSELSKHEVLQRFAGLSLTNILAKNARVDAEDMIVTLQKLLRRDIFGLEKYFIWGVTAPSIAVRGSRDRERALGWVESYVRDLNVHPRIVDALCMVADELLTNALYDAPLARSGSRRFRDLDRSVPVELDGGEEIVLKICCDGRRVGISVTDPFGSLEPDEILEYIERGRRKGSDQVRREVGGGAGLGLYLTFDALSHFVANLNKGVKTEMIGILDIDATYRELATRVKSFNIFVEAAVVQEATLVPGFDWKATAGAEARVALTGDINESSRLDEALYELPPGPVVLDLSGVRRISSAGVRVWMEFVLAAEGVGYRLSYDRVPSALVHQAHLVADFFGDRPVRSVMAPYFCAACDQVRERHVPVEAAALAALDQATACDECGGPMEFDDVPEYYAALARRAGGE